MGGTGGTTLGDDPLNTPVRNLERDLSDDHPIGIEYAGGSCTSMTVGASVSSCTPDAATGDADFVAVKGTVINGVNQYWVDVASGTGNDGDPVTGQIDTRQKTDMILYARDFGGTTGPSVECGSCHDPHEGQSNGNDVSFLRISNVNSQVCLACHIK